MTRRLHATDTMGLSLGDLETGDTLGDYGIDGKLPTRGTGVLYRAHHLAIEERRVTIHVMPAGQSTDDISCLLSELDHPSTPRVFGTGVLADQRRWVAIESIAGTTLADVLAHRRLSIVEVVSLLRDISEILTRAHRAGIVHCNLTPANIVVPDDRRTQVCITGWEGARFERSHAPVPFVLGGDYTAPEQIDGQVDDVRTDMFAVGVIAHLALHGVLPGDRAPATKRNLVETLIDHMLCRRPDLRPTSAKVRAAVAWLCGELEIMKRESWIAPTLALEIGAELPLIDL